MDSMIVLALEASLVGGVALCLVGSVVLFLAEDLGWLLVKAGQVFLAAFCTMVTIILGAAVVLA